VPFSGAWHSSELAVLFNNTPTTPSDTEAEIAIGSYFRGAWATFAKNPTTGLTTYQDGWPMYSPTEHTLVQLAYNNQTGNNLAMGNAFDGTCTQVVANTVSNSTSNSTSQSSTSLGSSASPTPSSTSGTFGATPSSGGLGSSNILSLKTLVLIVAVVMGLSI
jgi:cholinesterase